HRLADPEIPERMICAQYPEPELCCNEGQRKMGEYVIEYLLQGKKRYLSLVLRSV
ncbi:hypothetical protein HMPREF1623_00242, partial [Escherichia coli 910096-2]